MGQAFEFAQQKTVATGRRQLGQGALEHLQALALVVAGVGGTGGEALFAVLDSLAVERDDVRGMLKLLRAGRAIWYAPDQDYGAKQSIFVPLFGIQAATVTATSKFARLGKALVVPFTQERLADGSGYRLVIHPPLTDFPGETDEIDCLRINQWVEASVRECPEQYLWTHRRFKSRPPGEPKLYEKRRR